MKGDEFRLKIEQKRTKRGYIKKGNARIELEWKQMYACNVKASK
jgi:hypothetical protein